MSNNHALCSICAAAERDNDSLCLLDCTMLVCSLLVGFLLSYSTRFVCVKNLFVWSSESPDRVVRRPSCDAELL